MKSLKISPDLALPIEAATQTFGILAKKGAGKSNAAVVMAEEMHRAAVPWVAVDPKGDWWGVRSSADGKGPGLSIPVFGGRHGDVPLEPTAGHLLAELIVDKRLTCVLDVSEFSKADVRRFLLPFAERLYRLNEEPLHLFLEEAHEYLPQRVMRDEAQLVGAWSKLVKQGRFKGLGCTLVSQRSASLNKDVLTQCDSLIVLRTTAPQDRKAVMAWVEEHDCGADLVASLPTLESGEAWIWSPEFLGETRRFRFRRRSTFDSGATPEIGKSRRAPATLADVDLAAIKEEMAETIERAKADDPKELRRRIAELERRIKDQKPAEPEVVVERVEVPVLDPALVARIESTVGDAMEAAVEITKALSRWESRDRKDVPGAGRARGGARAVERPRPAQRVDPPSQREPRRAAVPGAEEVSLGKGEQKVLGVLAQWPQGRTQNELAFLAGYSAGASTIGVILSKLRRAGLVEPGQPIRLTEEGVHAAGGWAELPSGPELLEHWRGHQRMGAGERKVLDVLVEAYPDELSHADLCAMAGYSPDASTIGVILSKLRKLGLVEKGARRLAPEFAEAIA